MSTIYDRNKDDKDAVYSMDIIDTDYYRTPNGSSQPIIKITKVTRKSIVQFIQSMREEKAELEVVVANSKDVIEAKTISGITENAEIKTTLQDAKTRLNAITAFLDAISYTNS